MVDKNSILIRYFRDGESMSSISRELQLSRSTVFKYVQAHKKLIASSSVKDHLSVGLSTKPSYTSKNRVRRRFTTVMQDIIDDCLADNTKKRGQGLHKQLMKNIDIHEYLISKGHQISYSTVCDYIQTVVNKSKEAFIKQVYTAGSSCEFDWGFVKLSINGKIQSFQMAVFTCCYSNYRWAKLFYRQDTLAFMQSHIDFFSHTGGVHRELIYDNMRVAVARFTGPTEERATAGLLELSNYYKFGFRFCNIAKGNEKGHVERSVEYIRRKAFCKAPDFNSIDAANAVLAQKCTELNGKGQRLKNSQTAQALFTQEKSHLYPAVVPYRCFTEQYAKVDTYATITIYGNRYSVPDTLVGKLLKVRVFAEYIHGYMADQQVCNHPRSYGAYVWTLNIVHYLRTLTVKPGALKGSLAFDSLDAKVKQLYYAHFSESSKDFIQLLQYCKTHNICFSKVEDAITTLQKISPIQISKDKILTIMAKQAEQPQKKGKPSKANQEIELHALANLKQLTELLN